MWLEEYEKLLFSPDHTDESTLAATILKNNNIPALVYKYRVVNENSLRALKEGVLIAAAPRTLNDPNEVELYLDIKKRWSEFYKEFLELFYRNTGLRLAIRVENYSDRDAFIKGLADCMGIYTHEFASFKYMWALSDTIINERLLQFQREIRSVGDIVYRICSLSVNPNSRAMWAHYSDNYKGFCIAYNFKELGTDLTDLLLPMRYKKDKLEVDDSFFGGGPVNNSFIIDALTRKFTEWEYEEEWRLLLTAISNEPIMKVNAPIPKAVILGKDITIDNRDRLIRICKALSVPYMQQRFNDISGDFEYIPVTLSRSS